MAKVHFPLLFIFFYLYFLLLFFLHEYCAFLFLYGITEVFFLIESNNANGIKSNDSIFSIRMSFGSRQSGCSSNKGMYFYLFIFTRLIFRYSFRSSPKLNILD